MMSEELKNYGSGFQKVKISIKELMERPIQALQRTMTISQFEPWSEDKQRGIVISILAENNRPEHKIPPIAISHSGELLDGRQIYTSIRSFVNNQVAYMGKTFDELENEYREKFLGFEIECYLQTEDTITVAQDLFSQLNPQKNT